MLPKVKKPYVIYLAEVIYKDIADIKKNNSDISNIDAIEGFIGTKKYEEISSGKFHDDWFEYLKGREGQVRQGRTYVSFEHDQSHSLDDHLEKLYFRRRFGYGKYNIT